MLGTFSAPTASPGCKGSYAARRRRRAKHTCFVPQRFRLPTQSKSLGHNIVCSPEILTSSGIGWRILLIEVSAHDGAAKARRWL
jgi:hypothetical protein